MATVSVAKIKVRRGSDSDRRQVIFDNGELAYTTDVRSRRLFVGDGSTRGGNPAGTKFYTGNTTTGYNLDMAQVGDIIFNTLDTKLYCLTGLNIDNYPDYDNPNAYQFIGPRADNVTIEYDSNSGALKVKDQSIGPDKILDSNFDFANGIARTGPTGQVSVNFDNITIKVNGNGQLYVDQAAFNVANFNTQNQNINLTNSGFLGIQTGTAGLVPGSNKLWLQPNTTGSGYYVMVI